MKNKELRHELHNTEKKALRATEESRDVLMQLQLRERDLDSKSKALGDLESKYSIESKNKAP